MDLVNPPCAMPARWPKRALGCLLLWRWPGWRQDEIQVQQLSHVQKWPTAVVCGSGKSGTLAIVRVRAYYYVAVLSVGVAKLPTCRRRGVRKQCGKCVPIFDLKSHKNLQKIAKNVGFVTATVTMRHDW